MPYNISNAMSGFQVLTSPRYRRIELQKYQDVDRSGQGHGLDEDLQVSVDCKLQLNALIINSYRRLGPL